MESSELREMERRIEEQDELLDAMHRFHKEMVVLMAAMIVLVFIMSCVMLRALAK